MKKKELGQFYTPQVIAKFMSEWVLGKNSDNLLDPAVGLGAFLLESKKINPNLKITSFEIDNESVKKLKEICNFEFILNETDYLNYFSDKKYSSIICNPPYNKFQQIKNRKKYIKTFYNKFGIKLSGYSNIYVYFLIKCINELEEDGRCCFIVPYEFLNTEYGKVIKKYLLELKIIKHIIKFDNSLKLFDNVVTTSCVLCLEKTQNETIDFISLNRLEELKFPFNKSITNALNIKNVKSEEKWSKYFVNESANKYNNLVKFSSIAVVKRGIATGNNDYFTLNETQRKEYKLSSDVCVPCITKAPYINRFVITNEYLRQLIKDDKTMYVFDGTKASTNFDFEYIKQGEILKVNESYLTSHRSPWFSLEKKEIAPLFISVFSKNKLKIVMNEAKIKNLTSFHGVYFNKNVENEFIEMFFCYLLTPIAQSILKLNKREYGEGLNKFEPNDLNEALVFDIKKLSAEDKAKIKDIYKHIKTSNSESCITELNNIFLKYVLN